MNEVLKAFIFDTVLKSIRTFAQALMGSIGASAITLGDVSWSTALSAAGLATVLCVLMAFSNFPDLASIEASSETETES